MGVYERWIVPRLLDLAMRNGLLHHYRQQTIASARGLVLEVGVGSGLNLPLYGPAVARVVGLDPSPELLRVASRRAADAVVPVSLLRGSAEHAPFADAVFNTIVMTWTLCSIPNPIAGLTEMRRVLRPGGRLLFVEHGLSPGIRTARWQHRLTPYWKQISGGCHLDRKTDDLIRAVGFQVDAVETGYMKGPKPWTFMYQGSATNWILSAPGNARHILMPDARRLLPANDNGECREDSCQPVPGSQSAIIPPLGRRQFLAGAGATGLSLARAFPTVAQTPPKVDYTIRIAPVSIELAPDKLIKTYGYNGVVPGPVLRLKEGQQVSINVVNDTDIDDIIHWHGLFVPSEVDGAMEEGSPMVPAHGGSKVYTFTPKPTGTRWYHSHDVAGTDLTRSTYAGLYGFLIVEPTSDPGQYDKEVLLAAHHWEGRWVSMQDIRKGPPPENGLEVMYSAASLNDKMLGHGEPVRVREGERVLFRLLNASATENIRLALPGHRFTVLTLDGNPVPTTATVDVVALAPAERADVIVEMNRPGVWIMGEVDDDYRRMGLGIVIEYANQRGEPQWSEPPKAIWNYTAFGKHGTVPEPDGIFRLSFEKILGGRGGYNRWTINGKSWPNTNPLFTVEQGKRYRLVMNNNSGDMHPVHLHRHTFEVTKVGDKGTTGLMKDTLNMVRFTTAEIDFVADNPGPTLFHCHHQDHQDEGFMGLIKYV